MAHTAANYVGTELELFAGALNWKNWLREQMTPYISGRVLEAGAGIGGNTRILWNDRVTRWLALEPDSKQVSIIQASLDQGQFPPGCAVAQGTTDTLEGGALFDTVLYVDVLEHIDDDREELIRASRHLAPGGHLIVLSPAHQFLFGPFDASIGHFRRYDRASLTALAPPACQTVLLRMLDGAGFFLSLGSRLLMRSARPTRRQIVLWDSVFVPVSRWLDRLTRYRFGKSILAVWRKDSEEACAISGPAR
jgi:SAM-dependent methyltransferase